MAATITRLRDFQPGTFGVFRTALKLHVKPISFCAYNAVRSLMNFQHLKRAFADECVHPQHKNASQWMRWHA